MGTTTNYSFPFPELPDAPNVPGDMEALADAIDTALFTFNPDAIAETLLNAKGDLVVASSNDNAARLAVGTNGQVLTADSAQTLGVKWSTPSVGVGASATVFTAETTSSASFTDLATPGPAVTVTIGPAGIAVVFLDFQYINSQTSSGTMHYAMSGANTASPFSLDGVDVFNTDPGNAITTFARAQVLTGLTAGSTTFTAKYTGSVLGAEFYRRHIQVVSF